MLEEELRVATDEAQQMEEKHKQAEHDLEELLNGIEALYRMVNYEESPMMNLLGNNLFG